MTETTLMILDEHTRAIDKILAVEGIVPCDNDNREERDPCNYCNCIPDRLYYDERALTRTCISCAVDRLREVE
ncbi:MAG: hypothetical protein IMZ61_02080 [Planctomycetes bacterium]|nr:hypothetical protein [Thermoplasmata archaeon]MBE3142697.1 hypothetical protein [Planctomycetota bacterium]